MAITYTSFLHLGMQEDKNDTLNWDLIVNNWKTLDSAVKNRFSFIIDNELVATNASPIDADNIVDVGSYKYSAQSASYIDNIPSEAETDARLDVVEMPGYYRQQIIKTIESTPKIFIRNSTSSPHSLIGSLIPAMTSSTAPSGEVIESGHFQSRYGYYAFDGVDSQTYWQNSWTDGTNQLDGTSEACYVGYVFEEPVEIHSVKIAFTSDRAYVGRIEYRSNGVWHTALDNIPIVSTGYSVYTQTLPSVVECDAIRFCVISGAEDYFATNNYGGNVCEFWVYGKSGMTATWGDWYQMQMQSVQNG